MATSKKTSVKKPVTKKAAPKRVAAAAKAPAKRTTTVRTVKRANTDTTLASGGKYTSFKANKAPNFFSVRVTDQTIYWAILGFIVLALGVWIVTINDKIQYLYDQIDQQNANTDSIVIPKKR